VKGFNRRIVARLFVGLCTIAGIARAQSPLAVPDIPVGLAGYVRAIARQPDGGMIVGGQFTMVDGVSRHNLARLFPDGSLDPDWNPSANGTVHAVVVDAAGAVYVGGEFTEVAGVPRNHLARIIETGSLDLGWDPGRDLEFDHGTYYGISLALGTHGELFASGDMRSDRLGLSGAIKISNDATGTIDPLWNPRAGGSLVADTRGFVYIAGGFSAHAVQKVSQSGRGEIVADWHPPFDTAPSTMAVGTDDSLYLGWSFYYSQERHLGRIPPDSRGAFDPLWNPVCESDPTAFAFDGDAVYVSFQGRSGNERIVRLTGRTGTHVEWQAPGDDNVRALAVAEDGSLLVGGKFAVPWDTEQSLGLHPKLSLARLDAADAHILPSADAAIPGTINAIVPQSNGAFLIGGQFDIAGTTPRANILRMTADGRVDPDWNPALDLLDVRAIAVDGEDVYVSGQTPGTTYQNAIRSSLVKVAGSGAGIVDPEWHLSVWGEIDVLAMDHHGGMYMGGAFDETYDPFLGEDDQRNLWKLSLPDATPDKITYARASPVLAIAVDADEDAVYIASGYSTPWMPIGGENSITRLSNTTGSSQHGWSRSLSSAPRALGMAPDGSLYAAGHFPGNAPDTYNDILKFTRDGSADSAWNASAMVRDGRGLAGSALAIDGRGDVYLGGTRDVPWGDYFLALAYAEKRSGASGAVLPGWSPPFDGLLMIDESIGMSAVNALAISADGTILVGGNFTMAGGEPRSGFAAFAPGASGEPARGHSSHAWPAPLPPPVSSPARMRPVPQATAQQATTTP
jgi:uncharacterized delta-60 repeat protein